AKSHTTEYKSIRIYSTALTASQVASNYAADTDVGGGDESVPVQNPETGDMFIVFVIVAAAAAVCAVTVVKVRK
ncbi:MAG TPA: hypothetical protein PLT66_06980, partial [Bacillota bacterium]|nr:hypothetical protein [Bacillota bacterium]